MKQLVLALPLLVLPAWGHAEDVWRWTDAQGKVHYSNVSGTVPDGATRVTTPIVIETDRLPGASRGPQLTLAEGVVEERDPRPAPRTPVRRSKWLPGPPKIYDDARLRFDCYAGNVLYNGGFAHADDIAPQIGCLPYRLGPEAWLNGARAELAMRQSGISVLDMYKLYTEDMKQP